MNNEKETLEEAKKLVPYISIQDRVNEIQILLQGIGLQKMKIARLDIQIKNNDLLEVFCDDLEEIQEKQKETLRGLKNSLTIKTMILHKQAQEG